MILKLHNKDSITRSVSVPENGNTLHASAFLFTGDGSGAVLAIEGSLDNQSWSELGVLTDFSINFTPQEILPYKYIRIKVKQAATEPAIALTSLKFSDLLNITLS